MARRIAARRSPIHGNGVFALVDIPRSTELIEYRGKRLTHAQADRLYANTSETGHTFLFTLNDKYVLDANSEGNIARWINHSCKPNCRAVLEEDPDGDRRKDRVLIETLRPLKAGEELTYDYGIVLDERLTPRLKAIWACRCGSRNCTGTLLKPKRKPAAKASSKGSRRPS
ncbi:MAG TPA: SET domain-containing protein-lysine N-methyltransferase [Dokdonella sp.]